MKSVTYNLSMREKRMHDALKGTRKIHDDDLDLFSFIKRKLEEIVLEERGFSIFDDIKGLTGNRVNDVEGIGSFIAGCLKFVNGDDRGKMIESIRDMDIFIEDAIHGILAKTVHSGNGSHGMIFMHFKKSRLNIRNGCFSVVELKRNVFNEIGRTVIAYISVIRDDKDNRERAKGEMLKVDGSSPFGDVMTIGTAMRADKRRDLRFKVNI